MAATWRSHTAAQCSRSPLAHAAGWCTWTGCRLPTRAAYGCRQWRSAPLDERGDDVTHPLPYPLPRSTTTHSRPLQNLFEQATFENASLCDTADYALLPNGTVTVLNRERQDSVDGPERALTGYATCPDGPPACTVHLQVSQAAGDSGVGGRVARGAQ